MGWEHGTIPEVSAELQLWPGLVTLRAVPFPLGCAACPNVSVNLITVSSEISVCKTILA